MSLHIKENKQMHIKFSLVMCVYKNDNPKHFKVAIESIINQTRKPDEVVLVVDGPIPEALDTEIKNYEDESFFRMIRLNKNVGHGNARRAGLENCTNELIALMDADDISVADRFEKQLRCFKENQSISVVGGNIKEFIGSVDNIIGVREVPQNDVDIKKYMKKRCPFNQMTVMLKYSDVEAAGGYIDLYCEEDYYLWIRMYQKKATFKNLEDSLVLVRVGNEMYQRRGGWKYFRSEVKIQKYMFNNKIINPFIFVHNVLIRFIIQVIMPYKIRGYIYKKFARKGLTKIKGAISENE